MKSRVICLLMAVLLLTGCSTASAPKQTQYQATFLTLFDTVTTIVGYAETENEFHAQAQQIHDELLEYHQLFDIYSDYENVSNIKTINDRAGVEPVQVDERIIRLLQDCRGYYEATGGKVNVAMGSVLQLWHEARNDGVDDPVNAYLPDREALAQAAGHTSFDSVVIDEAAGTVYLSDPQLRLDVGAVAKGWAVQQVCENASGGMLVSVGGNVCATGSKPTESGQWVIGIQSPDDPEVYLHTVYVNTGCVVTSGDYQRYYVVDGKSYHHIIDPDTLYPSQYWRSVTILCEDSGTADALSTALFMLPQDAGLKLLEQYQAQALWVDLDGNILYSPGFQGHIRT